MAASIHLITDVQTVITNGLSGTTMANGIAPAGVIQDLLGNLQGLTVGLNDVKRRLVEIMKDVDASDPQLATLTSVLQSLS